MPGVKKAKENLTCNPRSVDVCGYVCAKLWGSMGVGRSSDQMMSGSCAVSVSVGGRANSGCPSRDESSDTGNTLSVPLDRR